MMSLRSTNEAVLQAVIEILLPIPFRVPEVCIVIDGMKKKGEGCFGFIDIFIPEGIKRESQQISNVILELKYITLIGLLSGANQQWIKTPNPKMMEQLDKEIEEKSVEEILKYNYMYWSVEKKCYVLNKVNDIVNHGQQQLDIYIKTMAKGKVRNYSDSGIVDSRVGTKKGPSQLRGYLILTIGSHHVLVWSSKSMTIDWKYYIAQA